MESISVFFHGRSHMEGGFLNLNSFIIYAQFGRYHDSSFYPLVCPIREKIITVIKNIKMAFTRFPHL